MHFNPYLGMLVFALFAAGFVAGMLMLASCLGPKNPTHTKQLPFECGAVSVGEARQQRFGVRFYLLAMLFILFDIEIVFMYPWAVVLDEIGWPGFFSMLIFVLVLAAGFIFIWRKRVLDWNSD